MLHQDPWHWERSVWITLQHGLSTSFISGGLPQGRSGGALRLSVTVTQRQTGTNALTSSESQCQMLRVDVPTVDQQLIPLSQMDGISMSYSAIQGPQRVLEGSSKKGSL
jgi:hypothetical protein